MHNIKLYFTVMRVSIAIRKHFIVLAIKKNNGGSSICLSIPLSTYGRKALILYVSAWRKSEAKRQTDCKRRQLENVD